MRFHTIYLRKMDGSIPLWIWSHQGIRRKWMIRKSQLRMTRNSTETNKSYRKKVDSVGIYIAQKYVIENQTYRDGSSVYIQFETVFNV